MVGSNLETAMEDEGTACENETACQACTKRGDGCSYRATAALDGLRLCGVHHRQRAVCQECPICLMPMRRRRSKYAMRCGHAFHAKCIRAWFRQRPLTCPVCRAACLEGMALLGPRLVPRLHALLRTTPPPPRSFFPAYIVNHLQSPSVIVGLGGDEKLTDMLVDIACECFTETNFFTVVRGTGL